MKKILYSLVTLFLFLSACGSVPETTSSILVPINVCFSATTTTQATTWYAYENGLFEKYGLSVNLIGMEGGAKAATAIISGDADICQMAANSVVNAVAAGQDLVIVATLINTFPGALIVNPEIQSLTDLQGKIIGTGLVGSASEVAARLLLEQYGLVPGVDVSLVEIGEEPDRVASFEAGQVDAILSTPPFLHILQQKGYSILVHFSEVDIPIAQTSITTSDQFIEENRPVVISFMKAIIEAIALMKADPEGTKSVIAEYLLLDLVENADDLEDAYVNTVQLTLRSYPLPSLEGLQTVIDSNSIDNPAVANLTPEQLIDLTILEEIEASGFLTGLDQ